MRTIRLHAAAVREALEAAEWDEARRPGMGIDFERAIGAALGLLEEGIVPLRPVSAAARARGVKRLSLKRFPYDVVVLERDAELVVIAFAHYSRRPGYGATRRRS